MKRPQPRKLDTWRMLTTVGMEEFVRAALPALGYISNAFVEAVKSVSPMNKPLIKARDSQR